MRTELRCRGDQDLLKKLLDEPNIGRAVQQAKEAKDLGVRRRLLASSLRVTPRMIPRLDAIVRECRTLLAIDGELETYVYPDATFNAACVKPEGGRVFLMFSSGLLEAFDDRELAFVVGHELGHHMFAHHDMPIAQLSSGDSALAPGMVLELFAWSRYAEISADRAGLACTKELDGVARAFFKLSSGLKGGTANIHAEDLIAQLGDMERESKSASQQQDWFATHPFSPLRLRAAKSYLEATSPDALELEIQELMGLMQPTYLDEKSETAEAMRRLLRAGGVRVAAASDGISPEEIAQLEKFFGEGSFSGKLNVEGLVRDLERRARDVCEVVPPLRRIQVLRDLCLIALADGRVDEPERVVLEEIARMIEVDGAIVTRTLDAPPRLD